MIIFFPVIPGLNDAFKGEYDRNHTLGTRIAGAAVFKSNPYVARDKTHHALQIDIVFS